MSAPELTNCIIRELHVREFFCLQNTAILSFVFEVAPYGTWVDLLHVRIRFTWDLVRLNLAQFGRSSHHCLCILCSGNYNELPSKSISISELTVTNSECLSVFRLAILHTFPHRLVWFDVILLDISSKYLLGHYVENTGNSTLLFLEIFRSGSVSQTICRVSNSLSYRPVPGYFSHSVACTDASRACQSTSRSRWRYHCQFFKSQAGGRRPHPLISFRDAVLTLDLFISTITQIICHVPVRVFER